MEITVEAIIAIFGFVITIPLSCFCHLELASAPRLQEIQRQAELYIHSFGVPALARQPPAKHIPQNRKTYFQALPATSNMRGGRASACSLHVSTVELFWPPRDPCHYELAGVDQGFPNHGGIYDPESLCPTSLMHVVGSAEHQSIIGPSHRLRPGISRVVK